MIKNYYCIKDFEQFKVGHKFENLNGYVIHHLLIRGFISETDPNKIILSKKKKANGIKSK